MSQENVEIVRAQYASFGQLAEGGEVHSWVLGYFDPNCEYRPVEEVNAVCGHQALIGWTKCWLEAWSSYSDRVEEIIDGGEIVVAAISINGRGRTSGVDAPAVLSRLRDARGQDPSAARVPGEAAGLRE